MAIPKMTPGVHTIQLPELFAILHKAASKSNYLAVKDTPDEWNGGITYDEALHRAEFGWRDAPPLQSITLPNVQRLMESPQDYYDVSGEILDIGAMLAGAPEHWIATEYVNTPDRIIKLSIEIGGAQTVRASDMASRGQAIVALISSLELASYSVELVLVRALRVPDTGAHYRVLIPIKFAGQALDIPRLQFIIGHPSFYRRLLFGLAEYAKNESMYEASTSTEHYAPEGYTHIPCHAGLYDSIEWAQEFAESLIETPAFA
jgi:hypothetical protein